MATFGSNRRFSRSRTAAPVAKVIPARALSRFLLTALIASATAIGLWSLRYLLPSQPQAIRFENFTDHHTAFTIHAVFASIALLVGPWQFLPSIFSRRRRLHRLLGWIYVSTVALAWLASLPLALHAHTGATASAGFQALGVVWLTCTLLGFLHARAGRIVEHRRWMIRSYALTTAAITLRLYVGGSDLLHIPLGQSYPYIAWLCWIPNAVVGQWLTKVMATRPFPWESERGLASSPSTFHEPRLGQNAGGESTPPSSLNS
jgi:uncharacterized membrane protein